MSRTTMSGKIRSTNNVSSNNQFVNGPSKAARLRDTQQQPTRTTKYDLVNHPENVAAYLYDTATGNVGDFDVSKSNTMSKDSPFYREHNQSFNPQLSMAQNYNSGVIVADNRTSTTNTLYRSQMDPQKVNRQPVYQQPARANGRPTGAVTSSNQTSTDNPLVASLRGRNTTSQDFEPSRRYDRGNEPIRPYDRGNGDVFMSNQASRQNPLVTSNYSHPLYDREHPINKKMVEARSGAVYKDYNVSVTNPMVSSSIQEVNRDNLQQRTVDSLSIMNESQYGGDRRLNASSSNNYPFVQGRHTGNVTSRDNPLAYH